MRQIHQFFKQQSKRKHVGRDVQEAVQFVATRLSNGQKPADIASLLLDHCLSSDPKTTCGVGCDNMTSIVVVMK